MGPGAGSEWRYRVMDTQKATARARGRARMQGWGTVVGLILASALALPASAQALTNFTWSGATPSGSGASLWSQGTNWEGGSAPSTGGSYGTLSFPSLTGNSHCTTTPPTEACHESDESIGPMSFEKLSIDDGEPYFIDGEAITLGAGGLEATPPAGSISGVPFLDITEIALGSNQSWSIDGGNEGGGLDLGSTLTGSSHTLAVTLSEAGYLNLAADDEVGATTLKGANASLTGSSALANGFVALEQPSGPIAGELDASDGQAVTVEHVMLDGVGSLGPLTLTGGQIQVGNGYPEPGLITVDGAASLDSTSQALFTIAAAGSTAGTDYGQLEAPATSTSGTRNCSCCCAPANRAPAQR